MEHLPLAERASAGRDKVTLRKVLINKELSKRARNAKPSYGKFLWDRAWDRIRGLTGDQDTKGRVEYEARGRASNPARWQRGKAESR